MTITDRVGRYVAAQGGVSGGTQVWVWTNSATGTVENRTTSYVDPANGQTVTPGAPGVALVATNDSPVSMPLKLLNPDGSVRQTLTLPALSAFTRTAAQMSAVGVATRAQAQAIELANG